MISSIRLKLSEEDTAGMSPAFHVEPSQRPFMVTNLLISSFVLSGNNLAAFVGAVGIVFVAPPLLFPVLRAKWGTAGLTQRGSAPALGAQSPLQTRFGLALPCSQWLRYLVMWFCIDLPATSVWCRWCRESVLGYGRDWAQQGSGCGRDQAVAGIRI